MTLGRQGGGAVVARVWETGAVPMIPGGWSFTVARHRQSSGHGNNLSDSSLVSYRGRFS